MTYAIMMCFDDSAAKALVQLRTTLAGQFDLKHRVVDHYSPHVTLAIVEELVPINPAERLRHAAQSTRGLTVTFSGVGVFQSPSGFTLLMSVAPSMELLRLHASVESEFASDTGQDTHYARGKWLPHCTIASGVDSDVSLDAIFRCIGKDVLFRSAKVTRLEIAYTADKVCGPLEVRHSISLD